VSGDFPATVLTSGNRACRTCRQGSSRGCRCRCRCRGMRAYRRRAILWGLFIAQISKSRSPKNTYGWVRAEVLGAMVNSVFLLALCFAIVVEAIQRLTTGDAIVNDPDTLLYVGIVGLVFNLVALALFHRAASHGHGHGRQRKARTLRERRRAENVDDGEYRSTLFTIR